MGTLHLAITLGEGGGGGPEMDDTDLGEIKGKIQRQHLNYRNIRQHRGQRIKTNIYISQIKKKYLYQPNVKWPFDSKLNKNAYFYVILKQEITKNVVVIFIFVII